MTLRLVVGVDGSATSERALSHAKRLAKLVPESELVLVYVIEWSPFTFQTAEENAERHKRRMEEIDTARTRVVDPAVEMLRSEGFETRGLVRHGKVAHLLNSVAIEENADQIVVGRVSAESVTERVFGTSTANLVMGASVPVTVVT